MTAPTSLEQLTQTLRAVVAHTAPFDERALERFFQRHESRRKAAWTWDMWYDHFPPARCELAAAWVPGYCQRFTAADLQCPDCQVIADPLPAHYVLGAIQLSDGQRFVPRVRPNRRRGETLLANLWRLTHQLRAQYTGAPTIIE